MWTQTPFVKLAAGDEQTWLQRFTWQGVSGEMQTVSAYTNQPEAELFLNGRSLGRKEVVDYCASWKVPYEDGVLRAVADGVEDELCTAGKAVRLTLTPDKMELIADQQDVVQVEAALLDANGRPVGTDEIITYQVLGDVHLLGIENGCPDDLTCYAESHRATWNGRALVYLRAGKQAGFITLHAFTESGLAENLVLQSR